MVNFKKLNGEREKPDKPPLYNMGNCGLHAIHGAFEIGFTSVDWELGKITKSMFKLFNKSPARRGIYITMNNFNLFPTKYFLMIF